MGLSCDETNLSVLDPKRLQQLFVMCKYMSHTPVSDLDPQRRVVFFHARPKIWTVRWQKTLTDCTHKKYCTSLDNNECVIKFSSLHWVHSRHFSRELKFPAMIMCFPYNKIYAIDTKLLHPGLCCVTFMQKVPGTWASKLLQSTRALRFSSNSLFDGHDASSFESHW